MSGVTVQEVLESLSVFDIQAKDDELEKMLEIAQLFSLDADSVVDEWLAYQSTHGCSLSIENLDKLQLQKTVGRNKGRNNRTPLSNQKNRFTVNSMDRSMDSSLLEVEEDDLLNAYGTPKARKSKAEMITPQSTIKNRSYVASQRSSFSPSSFSPSSQPSQKYGSRSNAGEVMCKFGPSSEAISTYRGQQHSISVNVGEKFQMKSQCKYMFQKLVDLADVMDEMIEVISEAIKSKYSEEIGELQPCTMPSQEPIFITGRICCDQGGGVGRLNAQSVLLQGSKFLSKGKCISVDISQMKEFSLFPGQIVILLGTNPSGRKFIATEVFSSTPSLLREKTKTNNEPLGILVAAGPFTTSDCLSYEPLNDLLGVVKDTRPDVTILIGPIADMKHDEMNPIKFNASYDDVIQDRLNYIIDSLKGSTQLVFIPSMKDAACHPIYPQPPYAMALPSKDVHFVQDPCILDIDGVTIAVTSNDILFHLCAEEINRTSGGLGDRIGRLAHHVLQQRSFYPLCPSNETVNVDWIAAERYGSLSEHPDLLILPSDLKSFIKPIDGCVSVNPGRVAKGTTGGSYAQILVEPGNSGNDNISAQVVKI